MYNIYRNIREELLADDEELLKREDKCPCIPVTLGNDVIVNSLVDTGARVSCLQESIFEANRIHFSAYPILPVVNTYVTGFRGEKAVRVKVQILLPVTIQGITENISFLVVPGLVKQCILGIDGLCNLRTVIDVFNRTVTIGNESNHATVNYDLVKRFESNREEIAFVNEHVMSPRRESSASMKIPEALCYVDDDQTLRATSEISQEEIRAKVSATELDQNTQNKLIALCNRHKQCFRKEPGRFRSFEYKIPMRDKEPFFMKSYPVPTKYRDKVSREIEKMLAYGVIERSNTSFINPLVVVAKKDGSARVCLDARQVNERMIADHDGPEEVDQVLRQCDQIGVMSSIDLRSSFWQVPLNIESRKYTGFLHQGRTYQYTVVPFGLKISGAALHRAADTILVGLKAKVIDFVDDWLIVSPSIEQHLTDLDELLGRIERENVTVNFEKIELVRRSIRFIGFILTPEGIRADEAKTQAIQNFPPPLNVTQVKGFLGLVNFNARFTNKLAQASIPLLELTKAKTSWRWTEVEKQAFQSVKDLFCKELFLHHPVRDKSYVLFTDASTVAIAAALCQEVNPGDLRIVYAASRTLKATELNYFTTELELLAIVWALNKFRSYLLGNYVEIRTDHQALTYLKSCKFLSNRLTCWSLAIQDYNFDIKYIPGKKNVLADQLLRPPGLENTNSQLAEIYQLLTRKPSAEILKDLKSIQKLQLEDPHLSRLIQSGKIVKERDDLYHWRIDAQDKIYLPKVILKSLARETHELLGHVGAKKVALYIAEDFHCQNLTRLTAQALKSCDLCQRTKSTSHPLYGRSQPITPSRPNELISIDFIGPFPPAVNQYKHIFVIVDAFSKFVQIYPLVNATSYAAINCIMKQYIPQYGAVKSIQSDHGSQFTSNPWKIATRRAGICIFYSSIRHPQSNIVESYNKEVGRFLRSLASHDHRCWSRWCGMIAEVMNSTVNETTGFTPLELQTGKKPDRFWTKLIATQRTYVPHDEIINQARNNILKIGEKRANKLNNSHKITDLKIGEKVFVKALRVA
uniref:RNA-directed DNA polymerase n=1 Tax=Trichogramma kaykai TaxID=54128 RepID=A0ABD2WGN0_9HYME